MMQSATIRSFARNRAAWLLVAALLVLLLLTACQPALANPPRLDAEATLAAITPTATAVPLVATAPTPTADPIRPSTGSRPGVTPGTTLDVWVNETSPEHAAALEVMADEFHTQTGISLAVRLVSPPLLPELVNTAVLSDTLPDVILHPLEYSVGWAERGILDPEAANSAANILGRETFEADALDLVEVGGQAAALPSDGFHQLWLYRRDWFEERGLAVPDNYDDMLRGAESIFDREAIISGLVIPTESNLVNTHRAFEHLAIANGCQLVSDEGEVLLLDDACRNALDFYYSIVNQYSPPGVQTDTSARNAFLEERTGMIMASPGILTELAEVDELAANTGILTLLTGSGRSAVPQPYGNITYLGITSQAPREAAIAFAEYWFNEGYERWLAVESERKVPMRRGTPEEPRRFIAPWGTTAVAGDLSLQDIYGEDVVAQLRDDVATGARWGFAQDQGSLITNLFENLTFSIVLQEMLSGYFTSEKSIFEAYNRVINLIPNYPFPIEPTPTPPEF